MTILLSEREKGLVRDCLNRKQIALQIAEREQRAVQELLTVIAERSGADLSRQFNLLPDGTALVQDEQSPTAPPN